MMIMDYGMLICCSLPHHASVIPLASGENMDRPEPEVGESRFDHDARLPWYTSGFK